MKTLKSILKIILGLIVGGVIGFVIAMVTIVCFTDTTFSHLVSKLQSVQLGESITAAGIALFSFFVSTLFLVIVHEVGHLVCGLLSGYKFVSFRIFSLTFIRINGKLHIKRYAVAGTGGQCLMSPPDLPIEQIPVAWYNFGGVLANIIALVAVLPLFYLDLNPYLKEALTMYSLAALLLILMNGIPLKISGAGNDAFNIIALRKNMLSKRGLIYALRANTLIQNGVRPKDMPDEWFFVPDNLNYRNQLEVSIPIMAASRLVDQMNYPEALRDFEMLYSRKNDIIGLYVKEIACELVFLRLVCGDIDGAKSLLDTDLMKYIKAYRKVMSSKERILCSICLFLDSDRDKALDIYTGLKNIENGYLLQGEVKSDLAIMKDILSIN